MNKVNRKDILGRIIDSANDAKTLAEQLSKHPIYQEDIENLRGYADDILSAAVELEGCLYTRKKAETPG